LKKMPKEDNVAMTSVEISGPRGRCIRPRDGAGVTGIASGSPAPSAIEKAEAVRDALRQKIDAARAGLEKIDDQRREIAFSAHTEGGDAKKRLDDLTALRIAHHAEIESLETAIIEASRRVTDAEQEGEFAEQAEKAARAMEIAAGLIKRARKMDAALAILAKESVAYKVEIDELNFQLGIPAPHARQFQVAAMMALRAVIQFTPMRDAIEFVAPGQRLTMVKMAEGHASSIGRIAGPRLPDTEAAE
jgi:hypothetical protein